MKVQKSVIMNILFLTDRIPFPLMSGAAIRTFHLLKSLSARHTVHLISFHDFSPSRESNGRTLADVPEELKSLCSSIKLVSRNPQSRLKRFLRYGESQFSDTPWMVYEYYQPEMSECINTFCSEHEVNIIQAELLNMSQYLLEVESHNHRLFYGSHNVESSLLKQREQQAESALVRLHCHREANRTAHYEKMLLQELDLTITVTENDAARLTKLAPGTSIRPFPITVDAQQWRPLHKERQAKLAIVFVGTLFWHPNVDGLRWFFSDVFPGLHLPKDEVEIQIVGKEPTEDVLVFDSFEAVRVVGSVPDVAPYMAAEDIFIVPLRLGGGMRVKILEALSRGMAVISTSIGCEGIDVTDGENIIIADTADTFKEAIARLVADPALRKNLSEAGRRLIEEKYDWHARQEELFLLYQDYC